MSTFPAHVRSSDGEQRSDLICPNCGGVIRVRAEGSNDMLVFECMVGHLYTLEDFVVGKEDHIEDTMWAVIYAYQELAAFLSDLDQRGADHQAGASSEVRTRRQEQAEMIARRLRELFEQDHRITLRRTSESAAPAEG